MTVNVLVAYATKYGSTREIAEAIGDTVQAALGREVASVQVSPAHAVVNVAAYDVVVLGSALYAAHWRREANRFVVRHRAALAERPVWLFSSGPLDRSADSGVLPATPAVIRLTDPIHPREHRTFGGRLLAETPGLDAQILATHPVGDFRDWTAIRAWATRIADQVAVLAATRTAPTARPG